MFPGGKYYNTDLNASCNVGARYFIRGLLNESGDLKAEVPKIPGGSQRVLSDLWTLNILAKKSPFSDAVILEDIDLRNMGRSLHLGKATNDNGFGMFRTFLTYKMKEQGEVCDQGKQNISFLTVVQLLRQ